MRNNKAFNEEREADNEQKEYINQNWNYHDEYRFYKNALCAIYFTCF